MTKVIEELITLSRFGCTPFSFPPHKLFLPEKVTVNSGARFVCHLCSHSSEPSYWHRVSQTIRHYLRPVVRKVFFCGPQRDALITSPPPRPGKKSGIIQDSPSLPAPWLACNHSIFWRTQRARPIIRPLSRHVAGSLTCYWLITVGPAQAPCLLL